MRDKYVLSLVAKGNIRSGFNTEAIALSHGSNMKHTEPKGNVITATDIIKRNEDRLEEDDTRIKEVLQNFKEGVGAVRKRFAKGLKDIYDESR